MRRRKDAGGELQTEQIRANVTASLYKKFKALLVIEDKNASEYVTGLILREIAENAAEVEAVIKFRDERAAKFLNFRADLGCENDNDGGKK